MNDTPESNHRRWEGSTPARTEGLSPAELDALQKAGIDPAGSSADPTGQVQIAAGQAALDALRQAALTESQAAAALGVPTDELRHLVVDRRVAAVAAVDGRLLFPAWQFPAGRPLPGLARVCQVAANLHPLTVAAFMTRPDVDLEVDGAPMSPVTWLAAGGEPGVVVDLLAGLHARG